MNRHIVIAALLAFLAPPCLWASDSLDRIIAVADQEIVLASELRREVKGIQTQLMRQGQPLPDLDQLRRQVLERLVMQRLQLAHAERAGITVDDATLDAAVQRIAAHNTITFTPLRCALAQQGIVFAEFRTDLRE